jgi:membrane protease YdiL (CAAX protease family)
MHTFTPWFHIILALLAYFVFAIGASFIARKVNINLKEMAARTSPKLLLIGLAANLAVLVIILLMVRFLDDKSINSLGLTLSAKDLAFSLSAAIGTVLLAVIYIWLLKITNRFEVIAHRPATGAKGVFNMAGGLGVLLVVAIQEEVLYRGYISMNLVKYGPMFTLMASTVIFLAIHFLTNRISIAQIISWLVSGLVLGMAYLITGSIWVPIIIHFAIDATNVLVFNITGQFSIFTISPVLTEQDRMVYRVVYGITILAPFLVAFDQFLNSH